MGGKVFSAKSDKTQVQLTQGTDGPRTMRAVQYKAKGEIAYADDVFQVQKPGPGEVLIKVEAAPLNPSDIYFMQGHYGGQFTYPLVPGTEGSGTVIASGGGYMGWNLMGKRVGFTRQTEKGGHYSKNGAYAEYCVTTAFQCITLDDPKVSFEQGSCSFVNPVTAIGLLEKCKEYKAQAVIQTGAASQLGRMMIKLFRQHKIPMINIVRREQQVELLKNEYQAEYVLDSSQPDFDEKLKELANKLNATVALEAVAGDMPGRLLAVMPRNAILITYGRLSDKKIGPVDPIQFLFKSQRIEPFLLTYWIMSKTTLQKLSAIKASKPLIQGVIVGKCFGFHQIEEAIEYYKNNMTDGKVFLKASIKPDSNTDNPYN